MTDSELHGRIQDLDVTLWVGKSGVEPVVDELRSQLENSDLVKAKFLRAARGGTTPEQLAVDLAERAEADLIETRGNTAVYGA